MNIKRATVMKYVILIILSVSLVGCATFTATGTEINGIRIYFPTEVPDDYIYLGRIHTAYLSVGQAFLLAAVGVGLTLDFTRDYQILAVNQALLIGADALIMIDKTTYDAIRF